MDDKNDITFDDNNTITFDTITTPKYTAANVIVLPQHKASIAYSIHCIPKLIAYLHTIAEFLVKET